MTNLGKCRLDNRRALLNGCHGETQRFVCSSRRNRKLELRGRGKRMRHQRRLRKLLNSGESKKSQVKGCSRADGIANAKLSILVSGGHRRFSRQPECWGDGRMFVAEPSERVEDGMSFFGRRDPSDERLQSAEPVKQCSFI